MSRETRGSVLIRLFPTSSSAGYNSRPGPGPAGSRVAYAGTNIPYYLLGTGLRNEVRYVNIDRHRDWLLHDYHREARAPRQRHLAQFPARLGPDANPTFKPGSTTSRPRAIQLLVVTRVNPAEGSHNVADRRGVSDRAAAGPTLTRNDSSPFMAAPKTIRGFGSIGCGDRDR